jgi:hypothetical protein
MWKCAECAKLALTIPLIKNISPCADAITPSSGSSDATCALTGVLFQLGGLGVALWSEFRKASQ